MYKENVCFIFEYVMLLFYYVLTMGFGFGEQHKLSCLILSIKYFKISGRFFFLKKKKKITIYNHIKSKVR